MPISFTVKLQHPIRISQQWIVVDYSLGLNGWAQQIVQVTILLFFLIWQLDTRFQVDEILGPTKMDLDLTQSVFKKFRKFIQVSADVYFH